MYVGRKPGENMNDECVIPIVKHSGEYLMVWGLCSGDEKVEDLIQVKRKS